MAKRPLQKMCLKCREVKPIEEFYRNNGWAAQNYADMICRECARKEVSDRDTARQYCWNNNRLWSDAIWEAANKKAQHLLINNAEFLSPNTSQKRKDEIETKITAMQFFSVMNAKSLYAYSDNATEDGIAPYDPNSPAGMIADNEELKADNEQVYSDYWGGIYTKRELRYLDEYLEGLQNDFVLDNVSILDYAKKVTLASLESDNKFQKMRRGDCSFEEWQKAQDVFDKLSKSAKFAECQRKEATVGMMGALSTIIMDIEINHHNEMPQVQFP